MSRLRSSHARLSLIFVLLLAASSLSAATLNVPGDYSHIVFAMEAAVAGDVVQLAPGTHTVAFDVYDTVHLKSGVTLRGNPDDPATVLVTGGDNYMLMAWETEAGTIVEGITLGESAGGALSIPTFGDVEFRDCVIRDLGALYVDAGGVLISGAESDVSFLRCGFLRIALASAGDGGAVAVVNGADTEFSECVFAGNYAGRGGGLYFGGAGATLIDHCTIAENAGGGVFIEDCHVDINNTIIVCNTDGLGLELAGDASVLLDCCCIFGNDGVDWHEQIVDQVDINGNMYADPLFCGSPGSFNFYIDCASPCAPDEERCCGLIGAMVVGCGVTAVEEATWSDLKSLY